jgi:UDP-hydrolysing UDP-N-acetyl-D-glucosamine 2-epimerase
VTGSIDEKVRHAITKLADYHFVSNQVAADRVIKLGEIPKNIHITGCPSIDLATDVLKNPKLDFDPFKKYGGVGLLDHLSEGYIVVLQHPVTTEYTVARKQIEETCKSVLELAMPTLWFWPNVDAGSDGTSKGLRAFRDKHNPEFVHFFKNFEGVDFLRLLHNASCLIGNSSVGIRECAFLGVPVVNMGSRQSGRDRGRNVTDVEHDSKEITATIREKIRIGKLPSDTLYGDGKAGQRIADLLAVLPPVFEKRLTY